MEERRRTSCIAEVLGAPSTPTARLPRGHEDVQLKPGPAAEVQQFKGQYSGYVLQRRRNFSADVVVAGAFPVAWSVLLVVRQGACGDVLQ